MTDTALHRIHAGLSARREHVPGGGSRIVLMRWAEAPDGTPLPVPIATFSPHECVETFCALSEGWEQLCPEDRALRQLEVARIFGGCP